MLALRWPCLYLVLALCWPCAGLVLAVSQPRAAGGEYKIGTRFLAIAESFGDNHTSPCWQVGGRFSIIPDTLQVNMTVGKQLSGPDSGRWMSFGLRFTPAKLF